MYHTAKGSTDRARDWVAGGAVGKFLAFDSILLGGKGEANQGGQGELVDRSEISMSEVTSSDLHADVLEAERMFRISRGIGILTRAE